MLHARAANIRCNRYYSNFLEIEVKLNKGRGQEMHVPWQSQRIRSGTPAPYMSAPGHTAMQVKFQTQATYETSQGRGPCYHAIIRLYYYACPMLLVYVLYADDGTSLSLPSLLRSIYPSQSVFCTTTSRLSYQLFIFIFYSNQLQNYTWSDRNSVAKWIE